MHNFVNYISYSDHGASQFSVVLFKLTEQSYQDRWIESTFKGSDSGKFVWSAGKFYGDANLDKG